MLLLGTALMAQTIDFTGVSISTERVKKVYPRTTFIMATGAGDFTLDDYNKYMPSKTALFGARFGMVWRVGFYVGAEIGLNGPTRSTRDSEWIDQNQYYGMPLQQKEPRFTVLAGAVLRLSDVWNIYAGSGFARLQSWAKDPYTDTWQYWRNISAIPIEVGTIVNLNHLSLMLGATYLTNRSVRATLGVGFNF